MAKIAKKMAKFGKNKIVPGRHLDDCHFVVDSFDWVELAVEPDNWFDRRFVQKFEKLKEKTFFNRLG